MQLPDELNSKRQDPEEKRKNRNQKALNLSIKKTKGNQEKTGGNREKTEEEQHQLLYLGFSIHQEVASDSFCFLINSSWLLVFILYVFSLFFSGFNLYCWRGIHFSQNNFLIFLHLFSSLLFSFHFWFRDLLRELNKKYEVLLIILFLIFLLFLVLL